MIPPEGSEPAVEAGTAAGTKTPGSAGRRTPRGSEPSPLDHRVWYRELKYGIPVGHASVRIQEVGLAAQEAEAVEVDCSRALQEIARRVREALENAP